MKHIKLFSNFFLNEGAQLSDDVNPNQAKVIFDAMLGGVDSAIAIYSSLKRITPKIFSRLEEEASRRGTKLEDIIDSYFKDDPSLLHKLDKSPELKSEVLNRTGLKDFSKIGRMSKFKLL